jgi:hypothetical protein
MSMIDFAHQGLPNEQDRVTATLGRIGNIAAVVAVAVVIFATLYFAVLYLGAQ